MYNTRREDEENKSFVCGPHDEVCEIIWRKRSSKMENRICDRGVVAYLKDYGNLKIERQG